MTGHDATQPMSLGQIGYEAYGQHTGWKTYDGRQMPSWEDLGEAVQGAWQAAGDGFRAEMIGEVHLSDITCPACRAMASEKTGGEVRLIGLPSSINAQTGESHE